MNLWPEGVVGSSSAREAVFGDCTFLTSTSVAAFIGLEIRTSDRPVKYPIMGRML